MYDLIVVGGGPAGLTAAIYAIRKRLNVLLISKDLGGKTNFHLELPNQENYLVIRGVEVVDKFKSELEYLNFARRMEKVEKITKQDGNFAVHLEGGAELLAKSVIIATGAKQQFLEVPGEREYLSRGLCYSAISYAPLFIDKKAVVIGGGDLALRSTAELATVAEQVHLVGATGDVLETPLGQKVKAAPNVTILEGFEVTRVLGNGYAERVVVRDPDGAEMDIPADGTFVEKALRPNSQMVADLVDTNDEGFIVVDCQSCTSMPGIFAAGDVTHITAEQVLVAVGEGVKAALSAYEYLLPRL
ncbi:MAG TPA: FAD-dependent oxidoreductase [Anaerolineae bacterium]|jgi:alkyl hydroperoxide reductase subunit F|nr:FAD-dependent oxidoreductase [Anaerolineae bacterium]